MTNCFDEPYNCPPTDDQNESADDQAQTDDMDAPPSGTSDPEDAFDKELIRAIWGNQIPPLGPCTVRRTFGLAPRTTVEFAHGQVQFALVEKNQGRSMGWQLNPLQREYAKINAPPFDGNSKPAARKFARAKTQIFESIGNSNLNPIERVIVRHEGCTTAINWNDNGAGISVGMFQANQRSGQLPALLKRMDQADNDLFANIFGDDLQKIVRTNPEKIRSLSFTNNAKTGPNELGEKLQQALRQPAFQQVQEEMLREKVRHAARVAGEYGIRSETGIALVADMINQLGEGGISIDAKDRGARKSLRFALDEDNEAAKLSAIVKHDFKGCGRAGRDRDILADTLLDGGHQSTQTKQIAIEPKTNDGAHSNISDI